MNTDADTTPYLCLGAEEIKALMAQQPPFLFLDEAKLYADGATASYKITGDEYFLAGHFKGNPVMPASIMIEALGQLGVLYVIAAKHPDLPVNADSTKVFFTAADDLRASRMCRPGDLLEMEIKISRIRHPLCMFRGGIKVGDERAIFADKISLTFDIKRND